jgi:hypothetical protein
MSRAAQIEAMAEALSRKEYDPQGFHEQWDEAMGGCQWNWDMAADIALDAVHPLIEAEVREQVAKEIELAVEIVMEHEIRDDLYTRSALQASMRAFGWAIAAIARGKVSE